MALTHPLARSLMLAAALLGAVSPASAVGIRVDVASLPTEQRDRITGEFHLTLSRSAGAIRAAALQELELESAPVHAELLGRADRYVDWVFDWWTSYILVFKAIAVAIGTIFKGDFANVQTRVQERLVATVLNAYEARFQPNLARLDIEATAATVIRSTGRRIDKLCFELNREVWSGMRRAAAVAGRVDPGAATGPDLCADLPPPPDTGAMVPPLAFEAGSRFGDVAARVTRPIMTTTASLSISTSAVVTFLAGYGIPVALIGGPVFVVIAAKSIFTLVDLLLAQLDSVVNRDAFERAVYADVEETREEIGDTMDRAIIAWIDAASAKVRENYRTATQG